MNFKSFMVFLLISVIVGSCIIIFIKDDTNPTISSIEEAREQAKEVMSLDYQAYTKPKNK
jgi:hypothetical protein